MQLKAILCDFDGSLVDKNDKYNPQIKGLLDKIKVRGVHFSLATGRAYYGAVQRVLEELELFDYHILYGGALIFNNKENNILLYQPISKESVKKILNYLQNAKLIFALETKNFAYMNKVVKTSAYTDITSIKPLSELIDFSNILKILIFGNFNRLSETQVENHKKNLGAQCKDISLMKFIFNNYGLDITSEKATKHTAVLEYEKLLNIPRNQIVAIGDGHNDYPLFTACGYNIAMENAPKELKEIADFIAPTVENSGTQVALQHVITKFSL